MAGTKGTAQTAVGVAKFEDDTAAGLPAAQDASDAAPEAAAAELVAATPPADESPYAALLARLGATLAGAGHAGVQVDVLRVDENGREGVVRLESSLRAIVRSAASALLHSGDGREWKYLGDGPAGEAEDRAAAYLHVSPLA